MSNLCQKRPESTPAVPPDTGRLLGDLTQLIDSTRQRVARTVNSELVLLYWKIGARIRHDILGEERAAYGEQIVSTLSRQLTASRGTGFSRGNLFHMIRFAEAWTDEAEAAELARHMGWSHFAAILYLDNPVQRQFYAELCRVERWSVRTLRDRVRSMLFERTAISRRPDALIRQELEQLRETDRLTPDLVFRDPYVLDFLGLTDTFSEGDLETAILRDIERFLLELGTDFAFLARQKRMTIGGQDYHLDLLFYHRGLARLVAIELKLGRFEAAYKGQMELYLRWLDKYERRAESENAPIGLILCAEKNEEQIELLQLNESEIRVAEYLTALPARAVLEAKLHDAVLRARERLEAGTEESGNSADEADL
jgi:predicted nuclease of restriction endonuclease-like (RecB) superfamily